MWWEAILLAGGKLEKDFAGMGDLPSKAYLPILGKRMADYVLEALRTVPQLKRIVSVVPPGASAFPATVSVSGGDTIIASISAGMGALLPETEMALLVTCDLPCLTGEGVDDFMRQCEEAKGGLCYSCVLKSDSENKFPGIPHTYVQFTEGKYCGGGLIGIAPKDFPALWDFADRATRNRKNLLKIAHMWGIGFILKLLLKRLSMRDAERHASKLMGFPAKGIPSRFPEIAFNVDDSKGLSLAKAFLAQKVRA